MPKTVPAIAAMIPLAAVLAGCEAPPAPETATVARVTAETPTESDLLWQSINDTLRDRLFDLDRIDRRAGVITTRPLTSPSWFEFWRPQPQAGFYAAEANIHTIQRRAAVHVEPAAEPASYDLSVEVERYRYRFEERQADHSAAAMRVFSGQAPLETGEFERPSVSASWIPLGRDAAAEQDLLAAILLRYGQTTVTDTAPEDVGNRRSESTTVAAP